MIEANIMYAIYFLAHYGCSIASSFVSKCDKAGALMQWLKLPAWEVGDRDLGFKPRSSIQVSKKKKDFPLTRGYSIFWRASVTEK